MKFERVVRSTRFLKKEEAAHAVQQRSAVTAAMPPPLPPPHIQSLALPEWVARQEELLALEREGLVHGSPALHGDPPEQLVERALQFWTGYHTAPVATHTGAEVVCEDPALLHYYGNRLVPFATRIATPAHAAAAREIALLGQRA